MPTEKTEKFKGLDLPPELKEPLKVYHGICKNVSEREGSYNLRRMASGMCRLIELALGEDVTTPAPPPQHHS